MGTQTTAKSCTRALDSQGADISDTEQQVNNGMVVIDTGTVFGGPPIGVNTTGQEAEGPHCVGGTGGH
ncbi:MAG: hypothetical protein EBV13_05655 [Actinobacteria bacterium]|nr:hypothetical protein [Actinomycetota bacterium]